MVRPQCSSSLYHLVYESENIIDFCISLLKKQVVIVGRGRLNIA